MKGYKLVRKGADEAAARKQEAKAERKIKSIAQKRLDTKISRTLRIEIDEKTNLLFKKDSQALGIPAYLLYREVLRRFCREDAKTRKEIYIGCKNGIASGYKPRTDL